MVVAAGHVTDPAHLHLDATQLAGLDRMAPCRHEAVRAIEASKPARLAGC